MKIAITSDSLCDLPKDILEHYKVELIDFYIETEYGRFCDGKEVDSSSVYRYIDARKGMCKSMAPDVDEYKAFFKKRLESFDYVIHICASSKVSRSYEKACYASPCFEDRVFVIDSRHISNGISFLVVRAAMMVKEGKDVGEIVTTIQKLREKISTTFLVEKTNFLYYNGRISKQLDKLCSKLHISPVLATDGSTGMMKVQYVLWGKYEKRIENYVKKEMKKSGIDRKRVFVTHSKCNSNVIETIEKVVADYCDFEETIYALASASVTVNCNANCFGVLFQLM